MLNELRILFHSTGVAIIGREAAWALPMTGEPDDVRVKRLERRWLVRVVEVGKVSQHFFECKADAEEFAEIKAYLIHRNQKEERDGARQSGIWRHSRLRSV